MPLAHGCQAFLVFSQYPVWAYCATKPPENVIYFLNTLLPIVFVFHCCENMVKNFNSVVLSLAELCQILYLTS